jgi:hypothetical protein
MTPECGWLSMRTAALHHEHDYFIPNRSKWVLFEGYLIGWSAIRTDQPA